MRQRVHIWHVAMAIGLLGGVASAGWWYAHRTDAVSVVARVNARYASVAGYEGDIATGTKGAPLSRRFRRRAVMRDGRLIQLAEVSVHPANDRVIRTYVGSTSLMVTVDGRSCWTKTVSDPRQISRDLGIGQPMIPAAERIVSAHRGGHGFRIETASSATGKSTTTTWDIDDDTFQVRSRTTQQRNGGVTRLTITRELTSALQLPLPEPLCAI